MIQDQISKKTWTINHVFNLLLGNCVMYEAKRKKIQKGQPNLASLHSVLLPPPLAHNATPQSPHSTSFLTLTNVKLMNFFFKKNVEKKSIECLEKEN